MRRLAIAAILAVCLGAPVAEMCDQWDHTFQDGNDTEANVVVVALCVGVAVLIARVCIARLGAASSHFVAHVFASAPTRVMASFVAIPAPDGSPPIPLRI